MLHKTIYQLQTDYSSEFVLIDNICLSQEEKWRENIGLLGSIRHSLFDKGLFWLRVLRVLVLYGLLLY